MRMLREPKRVHQLDLKYFCALKKANTRERFYINIKTRSCRYFLAFQSFKLLQRSSHLRSIVSSVQVFSFSDRLPSLDSPVPVVRHEILLFGASSSVHFSSLLFFYTTYFLVLFTKKCLISIIKYLSLHLLFTGTRQSNDIQS